MYGGCDTCNHSWGETKCRGCLWDGKSQRNTHWEPEELDITTPKKVVGKMISTGVLDKIRAEINEKIEQERFASSVFRGEEKDAVKAEQCTGSIFAYNNVIKIIEKYMKEGEE